MITSGLYIFCIYSAGKHLCLKMTPLNNQSKRKTKSFSLFLLFSVWHYGMSPVLTVYNIKQGVTQTPSLMQGNMQVRLSPSRVYTALVFREKDKDICCSEVLELLAQNPARETLYNVGTMDGKICQLCFAQCLFLKN